MHKAQKAIKKCQALNKKYYDRKSVTPNISIGAQVYIKLHHLEGPNYKLSPKFQGPFRVAKVLLHHKFELMHESTMEKCIKHWNEIKATMSDPWSISELEKR